MKIPIMFFVASCAFAGVPLKDSDAPSSIVPEVSKETKPDKKLDDTKLLHLPVVMNFFTACANDSANSYKDAEAWLLRGEKLIDMGDVRASELPSDVKDKMLDILSGVVWAKDPKRAREIARQIVNLEFQKRVLGYFDQLDLVNRSSKK